MHGVEADRFLARDRRALSGHYLRLAKRGEPLVRLIRVQGRARVLRQTGWCGAPRTGGNR